MIQSVNLIQYNSIKNFVFCMAGSCLLNNISKDEFLNFVIAVRKGRSIMSRLKKWIFNTFFKDDLEEIKKEYECNQNLMKYEFARRTKLLDVVRKVLKNSNQVIVGLETNKNNEEVLVVQWISNRDIWIMLYGEKCKSCNSDSRIMATYYNGGKETSYILIDDVLVDEKNVGNGSILMKYFIKYCKTTNAEYISGNLSSIDADHFDRSEHFYNKHGFIVEFSKDRKSGRIRYEL